MDPNKVSGMLKGLKLQDIRNDPYGHGFYIAGQMVLQRKQK